MWEEFKQWLIDYRKKEQRKFYIQPKEGYGRYCIAISVDDLLDKMEELEGRI